MLCSKSMTRLLLQTVLGFLLFFGSIVFGYIYLQHPEEGWYSLLCIVLTLACLILSALAMLITAKSTDAYLGGDFVAKPVNDPSIVTTSLEGSLQKHNFLVSQWRKTARMRDQMKLLRISNQKSSPTGTPQR